MKFRTFFLQGDCHWDFSALSSSRGPKGSREESSLYCSYHRDPMNYSSQYRRQEYVEFHLKERLCPFKGDTHL